MKKFPLLAALFTSIFTSEHISPKEQAAIFKKENTRTGGLLYSTHYGGPSGKGATSQKKKRKYARQNQHCKYAKA